MIDNVTRPQCYSAFYAKPHIAQPIKFGVKEETPLKVKVGSAIGSAVCALGATYLVAKHQSKALNKTVKMFSVKYNEKNMLFVAGAALLGGLFSGMYIDEPQYRHAKIREGIHQAVANILCPIALVGVLNNIYTKATKNIKLPQLSGKSSLTKFINNSIKIAPNLAVTAVGLIAGVFVGTAIANKINQNNKNPFEIPQDRKVKALDFIYHPDDVAAAFALADRQGALQKIIGKVIPPVFMMHGYEAGTNR